MDLYVDLADIALNQVRSLSVGYGAFEVGKLFQLGTVIGEESINQDHTARGFASNSIIKASIFSI